MHLAKSNRNYFKPFSRYKGDVSATLKELGSSQSVKSIIASMAIEGSLAGLDATVLNSSGVVQTAPPITPPFRA